MEWDNFKTCRSSLRMIMQMISERLYMEEFMEKRQTAHIMLNSLMWSVCVICIATELSSCSPAGRPMGHVIQGRLHLFIAGMPNRGAPLLNIPNGCTRKETNTGLDKLFVYEAI